MHPHLCSISRFLVQGDGPAAVEYAVMLSLILVASITIYSTLGQAVSGTFSSVNSTVGAGIWDGLQTPGARAGRGIIAGSGHRPYLESVGFEGFHSNILQG